MSQFIPEFLKKKQYSPHTGENYLYITNLSFINEMKDTAFF